MLDVVLISAKKKKPNWLAHMVINSRHQQHIRKQSMFLALGLPLLFAETSDVCLIPRQQELLQSLFKFHLELLYVKFFGLLTLFSRPTQLSFRVRLGFHLSLHFTLLLRSYSLNSPMLTQSGFIYLYITRYNGKPGHQLQSFTHSFLNSYIYCLLNIEFHA